ncbi:MAG: GNAT family N-acetyltransferase [Gammaproteobacteria bacterium]|nr:GNAT family N-acetyltransferase [Gammaproteobacteria bacterium]
MVYIVENWRVSGVSGLRVRPQASGDQRLLLQLFSEARAGAFAALGWSPQQLESFLYAQFKAQSLDYARRFPGARFDVIEIGNRTVGRFYVARLAGGYVLIDIYIAAAWRGRGIATRLIRDLQAEAGGGKSPISLHVHVDSPARELYTRLGFTAVVEDGLQVEMRWIPEYHRAYDGAGGDGSAE